MPNWIKTYVKLVDALNYRIGRFAMYLLYLLMGVLLYSVVSKGLGTPANWPIEMAQFTMVAYYMLGGPYSLQLDSNVRMDLLYGRWSDRTKAWVDAFSIFAMIFYLVVLLWGAYDSTVYSLGLKWVDTEVLGLTIPWPQTGFLERNPSLWRPVIWPIKVIMVIGIFLMLLQAIAFFFKDVARLRGEEL
ncbi:MAG: TRAP transporter small permease subunit [Rhodobacteraceae bacterium]|nr:TRAP transporter small permease subunit [Paracoccaceae bacterium]